MIERLREKPDSVCALRFGRSSIDDEEDAVRIRALYVVDDERQRELHVLEYRRRFFFNFFPYAESCALLLCAYCVVVDSFPSYACCRWRTAELMRGERLDSLLSTMKSEGCNFPICALQSSFFNSVTFQKRLRRTP